MAVFELTTMANIVSLTFIYGITVGALTYLACLTEKMLPVFKIEINLVLFWAILCLSFLINTRYSLVHNILYVYISVDY